MGGKVKVYVIVDNEKDRQHLSKLHKATLTLTRVPFVGELIQQETTYVEVTKVIHYDLGDKSEWYVDAVVAGKHSHFRGF